MVTVISILGGEKELGQAVSGPMDYDALIRKGIPLSVISHIKKEFDLPDSVIARIIGVSPRTFSRRRIDSKRMSEASPVHKLKRLSPIESDRIYRFARIISMAEDVFEDKGEALTWLNSPQHGLGGSVPFDMLQTDAGAREVEGLLIRIDYGVIS